MTKLVTITELEAQKDNHACSHTCESCTGKDGDGKGPVLYKIKDIHLSEAADGVTFIAYGITHNYVVRPHARKEKVLVLSISHKSDKTEKAEQLEFKDMAAIRRHINKHNQEHAKQFLTEAKAKK